MKKSALCKVAIMASIMLFIGGCGPGIKKDIPVTMFDESNNPITATIVAHNQIAPDWMLSRDELAMNYMYRGELSKNQLVNIEEVEKKCRIYTKYVRPSNLVAVASGGVLYTVAGGIGVGLGSTAFPTAIASQYVKYGAAATGLNGTANGIISIGGQTYTFESCAQNLVAIFPEIFPGSKIRVTMKSPQ